MKVKREYLILIAAAALLSAYLFFHDTGKVNYSLPSLKKVSQDDISRITIKSKDTDVSVSRSKSGWRIDGSGNRADKDLVAKMLSDLADMDITDLVSKSGTYKIYGLDDDNAVRVTAEDKDGSVIRDFFIGNHTTGGEFTYVKLPGDKNVYTAKGRLRDIFNTTADKLFDKKVLSFDTDSILKINIKEDGRTTEFIRSGKDGDYVWKDKNGKTIDTKMVENNLIALNRIEFKSWADKKPEAAVATLTLSDKDGIHTLAIAGKTDDGYIGTSSYAEKPFIIDKETGDAIMRALDELSGRPVKK